MTPLFTIIMSTYNREKILPRAIQSVLDQTYRDYELLVIDNGSTDSTPEVVRSYNDPRVRYIRNPNPTSSCDAPRNMGVQIAKGDLIAFLDDDDCWYPERLEKVKGAFEKCPEVAAVCHYENKRVDGELLGVIKHGPWSEKLFETLLYDRNCLSTCATTLKKSVIRSLDGFDLREDIVAVSDYDFWLRMAARGHKVHFIEEALGEFCVDGTNGSIANPVFDSIVAHLIRTYLEDYEKKSLYRLSKRGLRRLFKLYAIAGRSLFRARHYRSAVKHFLHAMLCISRATLVSDTKVA